MTLNRFVGTKVKCRSGWQIETQHDRDQTRHAGGAVAGRTVVAVASRRVIALLTVLNHGLISIHIHVHAVGMIMSHLMHPAFLYEMHGNCSQGTLQGRKP